MITWTEERVDTLMRHWENGLSTTESAKELGSVTRNGVAGKRYRLGLRDQMRSAHPPRSRMGMRERSILRSIDSQAQVPRYRLTPVPHRKHFRTLPEMSKTALREMLRCAVENTL